MNVTERLVLELYQAWLVPGVHYPEARDEWLPPELRTEFGRILALAEGVTS